MVKILISVIVPFYKGNQYLECLFNSIHKVIDCTKDIADYEVIIVNDSPFMDVILPDNNLSVKVIINETNQGIHGARINGVKHSNGDWIIFLDQDDEFIVNGFRKQIELTRNADVVVGNGIYILGDVNKQIYGNYKSMLYLIQFERFIKIRNLIPSPGECLIKKRAIPSLWMKRKLQHNGSDDWFLWLLLFKENKKFVCNDELVYIHNNVEGTNLSADLDKMRVSSLEMLKILNENNVLTLEEDKRLKHAIEFKYNQDTKKLSFGKLFIYADALMENIRYRITLNLYNRRWRF